MIYLVFQHLHWHYNNKIFAFSHKWNVISSDVFIIHFIFVIMQNIAVLCLFVFLIIYLIQSFFVLHSYPQANSLPSSLLTLLPTPPHIYFSERVSLPTGSLQILTLHFKARLSPPHPCTRLCKVSFQRKCALRHQFKH